MKNLAENSLITITVEYTPQDFRAVDHKVNCFESLLSVLEKHVSWWDENEDAKQGGKYIAEMRKAIAKARREL